MASATVHLQVETVFITHLHGDHCFGIGSMLVSLCNARRAQREQQQQQQRDWPAGEGPGALRLVGPPKLGELVSALLVGAGVGRRLDLPVYVTEFCEEDRCGVHAAEGLGLRFGFFEGHA
jgi:ribonuclease BN (tRNA processing enzyme)